ncbi:unnamed protein product, partial [Nesidiocoris tenuis]
MACPANRVSQHVTASEHVNSRSRWKGDSYTITKERWKEKQEPSTPGEHQSVRCEYNNRGQEPSTPGDRQYTRREYNQRERMSTPTRGGTPSTPVQVDPCTPGGRRYARREFNQRGRMSTPARGRVCRVHPYRQNPSAPRG